MDASGITGEMNVAETIDAVSRFTEKAPVVAADPDRRGLAAALWRHSAMTRRFEGHKCDILGISLRGGQIWNKSLMVAQFGAGQPLDRWFYCVRTKRRIGISTEVLRCCIFIFPIK